MRLSSAESHAPADVCYHMFLWLVDGRYDAYAFSDRPRITYDDGMLVVTSDQGVFSYQHEQVSKITFSDNEIPIETGISAVSRQPDTQHWDRLSADEVLMQGMKPDDKLRIYTPEGRMVKSYTVSTQGELTIKLSELPSGIYILKTNSISFKYIKQ